MDFALKQIINENFIGDKKFIIINLKIKIKINSLKIIFYLTK